MKHDYVRELGMATVVMEEVKLHRLPRLKSIKSNLEKGDSLSDADVLFMKNFCVFAYQTVAFVRHHRNSCDYYQLAARLCAEISEKELKQVQSKSVEL